MIDIKTLKIGDKVIACDVSFTNLIFNDEYTISEIIYGGDNFKDRIVLKEQGVLTYFSYRFKSALKLERKKKLKIICQK